MKTLREALTDYLAMRRALGFKLRDAGAWLGDFVSFLEREGAPTITVELALRWAQQPEQVRPAHWARRLSFVRSFAKYWSATDPRTEIPPLGLLPYRYPRARPYLYTDEEIGRLLAAAQQLSPTTGLRRWTYYTLFGLLVVTGLRISEAIALEPEDINWDQGVLTIRRTKFGKSRLIPIHPSSQNRLKRYAQQREDLLGRRVLPTFFVSDRGRSLTYGTIRWTFVKLSRQIGLRSASDRVGPRRHDFRHRFAVHTLIQWYRGGVDIERRLPVLSTYLGHTHVADTYWYLSAAPELLSWAAARLEKRWEVTP